MLRIMLHLIAIMVMPGRMIVKRSSRSITRGCMTAVLMYSVDAECNGRNDFKPTMLDEDHEDHKDHEEEEGGGQAAGGAS
jgi:hypothetical protein